jgi:glycosyltransferase involved in cell wall biosynthesis
MTVHSGAVQPATAARDPCRLPGREAATARKARIVLVQTQAEGAGAQEISRILGHGLEARGYEVHHVFFYRKTAAFDDHPNTFFCSRERPSGPVGIGRMFIALVRHLSNLRPAVVMCFQLYGCIIGALGARAAGIGAIVANRSTSMRSFYRSSWLRWLEFGLGFTGMFSRVVVNSKTMEDEYRRVPDWCRAHVVRIEHGFEPKTTKLSQNDARGVLGLPLGVTLLGNAARLHSVKNHAAAIQLLPSEPSWHLALAGQGPDHSRLVSVAKSLGVADRLHFLGELPPDRVGVFLGALDVFVFPSLVETFGVAVVEAAQAGVPVVANDVDVLREVLACDGKPCALFVDVNDTKAFGGAVRRLLDDPKLRAVLSARGAELSRRFSLDAMTSRYVTVIENVIHGKLQH